APGIQHPQEHVTVDHLPAQEADGVTALPRLPAKHAVAIDFAAPTDANMHATQTGSDVLNNVLPVGEVSVGTSLEFSSRFKLPLPPAGRSRVIAVEVGPDLF